MSTRAALEGERKHVTVLFCDLAGSTGLAERLGPESMHLVLGRFFDLALEEIHRYEGTVNQFLGDGFMALFGAPVAREDHARRAVLAALGVQRAIRARRAELGLPPGENFAVRIGINTGEVVVGKIGDNLRADYTAVGDTTNVAGRLEQLAEPGTILISRPTAELVEGYVELELLGPLPVRGRADPVTAYRVRGPGARRSRLEKPAGGPLGAFVGRDRELARLCDLLDLAVAGRGQVVGIAGDPGVGKSRLVREFRRRLAGRTLTWLDGHCVSYGQAMPYLPILDVIRQNCGIAETDDPGAIAAKLRDGLIEIGLDPGEELAYLLHLLGLAEGAVALAQQSPEAIKARTFELLTRMILAGSRRRPMVILVEDLHWADTISEEYAAALADQVAGARVLVVLTYRRDEASRLPATVLARPHASEIPLTELTPAESRVVLRSVREDLPEPVAREILDRASGNPLFLEELGRAAADAAGADGTVPATLQDVLAARIDRLADTPRRLLQTASALGRATSARLLGAVWAEPAELGEGLAELVRLDFLCEQPMSGERTFAFRHPLVQEVAYATLLGDRRRAIHGAVGRALETLYAGRTHEVVELLAHHFGRSGEDERAVDYAVLAADKAQRRWANAEALARFDEALVRLARMPESAPNRLRRIDAVLQQAEVRFALGRHAEHIEALHGIRELVDDAGDARRRAAWHYWTGFLGSLTGAPPSAAIASCRVAARIADAEGLEDLRAFAECCLAQAHSVAGDLAAAVGAGERALATFEARGNVWWSCRALWLLSAAANAMGDWARSLDHCRRALDHGAAVNDLRLRVSALLRLASTHIQRGDAAAGMAACDAAVALSPIPFDAAALTAIRGYGLVKLGETATGVGELTQARAWYERSHLRYTHALFGLWLGDGYIRLGERDRAREVLEDVRRVSRDLGYRHFEGVACRLLAEMPGPDGASHLAAAFRLLEAVGARNELARALVLRAGRSRAAGEAAAARRDLRHALALFEALGTRSEPERVRATLAELDSFPAV